MSEPVANVTDQQNDPWHSSSLSVFERLDRLENWVKDHLEHKSVDVPQDAPQDEVNKPQDSEVPSPTENSESANEGTVIES